MRDLEGAVREHQCSLLRYVEQMLPDCPDQAQDVVQNTFLRYRRALFGGKKIGMVGGWLYRVAHNLAVDLNRRENRSCVWDESAEQARDPATAGDVASPTEALGHSEAKELALQELSQLPENERQILLLKLMEGLTLREISELTGIKIGTIHYRLNCGLRTLRDRFQALGMIP